MLESDLDLTFYLHDDWLGLHQCVVDGQSAAVLPSIRLLHLANAAKHGDARQSAACGVFPGVWAAYLSSDS